MSEPRDARDVIAQIQYNAHELRAVTNGMVPRFTPYEQAHQQHHDFYLAIADDILATLKAEGYQLVKLEFNQYISVERIRDDDGPHTYRTPFNPNEGEKSQILVDAFGEPESIEEVRPGVTMYTWPAEDDDAT